MDFNFEIQYRPGKSNTDADCLSRIPADNKNYMGSCTERVVPESLPVLNLWNSDIVMWGLNLVDGPD